MAADPPRYLRVAPRFWSDPAVKAWGDDARLLALYLLTCPHRTTEGLFYLPRLYAAADLGWGAERLSGAWSVLRRDGFLEDDDATDVVLIPKALAYQAPANGNQAKGAIAHLKALQPTPLLARLYEEACQRAPHLAAAMRDAFPAFGGSDQPRPEPEAEADPEDRFEEFWNAYPRRNGKRVGKKQAVRVWGRMSAADREAAFQGVVHYADACDRDLTIAADAHRWLRDERWEEWDSPAEGGPRRRRTQAEINADTDGVVW